MKKKVISVILIMICLLILIIIYLLMSRKKNENMHSEQEQLPIPKNIKQLGNMCSIYFSEIGISFFYGNDFSIDVIDHYDFNGYLEDDKKNTSDPFYTYLPTNIPLDKSIQEKLLREVPEETIKDIKKRKGTHWHINNDNDHKFWTIMKPVTHKILSDILTKFHLNATGNQPIIHYRCSDVPFIKSGVYYLQNFQYYNESLEKLKNNGIDVSTVIIQYNTEHLSSDENTKTCNEYIKLLQEYLSSIGVKTVINSKTVLEDFAALFYAPAVITTGSSFAFMSGFFGNGVYISADFHKDSKCSDCHWMTAKYNINHEDVKSYYDIDEMRDKFFSFSSS